MQYTFYFPNTCFIIGSKIRQHKAQQISHITPHTLSYLLHRPQHALYCYPTSRVYETMQQIQRSMQYILAAGVIAIHNVHCLFIYRLGNWDLPKGKREGTEPLQTTALRELQEETGIIAHRPLHFLTETYHCYKIQGNYFLKKTIWYLAKADSSATLRPQQEEHIEKVAWIHRDAIAHAILPNTYPNIRAVIRKIKYL